MSVFQTPLGQSKYDSDTRMIIALVEHERGNGEIPWVKTIPFWKWSLVILNFDIPHKNLLFSKDVLPFTLPASFPQRISWLSIIILVSLSKHYLETSTSNKYPYSGKHSRKSSRWLRGDAEETLRAVRIMLFSPWKFCESYSWETLNTLPGTSANIYPLTTGIALGTTPCRIYRQSLLTWSWDRQAALLTGSGQVFLISLLKSWNCF